VSDTFDKIKQLVIADKIRVSQHAFRRLSSHSIRSDDLVASIVSAVVLEDYPAYYSGPAVLVLHYDANGAPLHAVWGIENGADEPAVLITAYRPDPSLWSDDFRTRKP
jgi:uncharacterized protein DUF4258